MELIATNANGSDTLMLPNYITVYPFPAPQGILQGGDSLYANAGAVSYQWYLDGNLIAGATNSFYVATQSGNYNVVATDNNGCEVEAVIFDVIAGLTPPDSYRDSKGEGVTAYPNPVTETLTVTSYLLAGSNANLSVYNMLGEKVKNISDLTFEKLSVEVDCSQLPAGIYLIELTSENSNYWSRFIKK